MLAQAARHQEIENEHRVRLIIGILEPAIVVAMGVVCCSSFWPSWCP
jgi:type II secretory pathway component PulF